jgi:hypothetical protein
LYWTKAVLTMILAFLPAAIAISQWRLLSRITDLTRVILSRQGVASQGTGEMNLLSAPDADEALPGRDQMRGDTGETAPLPPQPAAGQSPGEAAIPAEGGAEPDVDCRCAFADLLLALVTAGVSPVCP